MRTERTVESAWTVEAAESVRTARTARTAECVGTVMDQRERVNFRFGGH